MMIKRIMVPAALGLVAVVLVIGTAISKKQGDFFSHNLHVEEVGLDCETCHEAAVSAADADVNLYPTVDDCYACHEETDSFVQEYADFTPPWRDVIFSHEQHVTTLGMDCTECHTSIASATRNPSDAMPEMDACIDCHGEREINTACGECHTHVELIIPETHGPDYIVDHVEWARQDEPSCRNCHTPTYCQECHDGAALAVSIKEEDRASIDRVSEMAVAHDGRDILVLQRQHDLNYRYTHGTEAKTKARDCAICHETTTFCVACHRPETGGNRNEPFYHTPGFKSGGHADMARNDIELCAGCHDESAAEPSCLQCHRSISPHPAGFMEDVHGSWHDDDNAVCFVCHDSRSRVTGVGFCTNCHAFPE